MSIAPREVVRDLAILVSTRACLAAVLLLRGFSHVSDDDYSRVVIAEEFAHSPSLDPSGTSWLPFPFWITGSVMMVFGRSLATARGVAIVLGCLSPCLIYAALRVANVKHAMPIALCAMLGPWASWLSIATVPEAPTAALACAAIIVLARDTMVDRRDVWFGACIFAACLSRYEAWAMAAGCAFAISFRARKYELSRDFAKALALVVSAPLLWLAWNAYAHGDVLHFVARVSRYREHLAPSDFASSLALYPKALVTDATDALIFTAIAVVLCVRNTDFRARWMMPLFACAGTLAFLVAGAMGNGVPTHHPARALVILFPICVAAGLDAVSELASAREKSEIGAIVLLASLTMLPAWLFAERPATPEAEHRDAQIARGKELRAKSPAHVTIHPCAYEHFAVVAAFGAPERVTIVPPALRTTPNDACPALEIDSM